MPPTPSSIAFRLRALVGVLAAVVAMVTLAVASPAVAQEFGTTTAVPGTVAETVPEAAPETDPETGAETQTLVEAEPQEDRFLTSESRRIVVAIGGLVVVALMLMLLTVRYWRQTKPVAPTPDGPREADPVAPRTDEVAAVSGEDHAAVDEAWEPLATGEHARVDLPDPGRRSRPSTEARRKALGRT